jgi:Protein of unknown function (DUF3341)
VSASKKLLVGYFAEEHDILEATRAARKAGYVVDDVFMPYAVHGMDDALGMPQSRLPWVTFVAGLGGGCLMLFFLWWMTAVAWPINVGGKPMASIPAYIPVTFEFTVLSAGLTTVGALFAVTKLFPGKQRKVLPGVTNDRFALAVSLGAGTDEAALRKLYAEQHAVEISALDGSEVES